jgi:hypothetical protein
LLKELYDFEEALHFNWNVELKILLKQSINLKKALQSVDYLQPPPSVVENRKEIR